MSVRNLEYLFRPASVAVIGASERPRSVGATVFSNLLKGSFRGAIMPVNPKHKMLAGREVYGSISHLPAAPELAVICTPPLTVPGIVRELGEFGTKAAIILTAGLGNVKNLDGVSLKQAMLDAAKPYLLRILGPNCVGLLAPGIGLNASFAHIDALPGRIAFVSQSGALVTAVLDWARSRGIGFSKFISLGDSADVDFGDTLDYLASDADTQAILLYMEDVRAARKFMSAARAAARNKPVLIVKAGRVEEGAKAAFSHTGALAGSDDVYDAAIRRAGMLRVLSTEDLFSAVETLARAHPLRGDRLAIMTNGGGPGVLATDALVKSGGRLATLSDDTVRALDAVLPPTWSRSNPVDIIGDAPPERYAQTMQVLLQDQQVDAVLLIHAPTAIVPSIEIAQALEPLLKNASRNIISCWLGGHSVADARSLFSAAAVPCYDTPEDAVAGFMQMVDYRMNQSLLMQVPPATPSDFTPRRDVARAILQAVLDQGRTTLSEPEATDVLAAYGIPVVETRVADRIEAAVLLAERIGFPVALKILSPDITHKSDVGGVVLDLESGEAVREAAQAMNRRLHQAHPQARLHGFSVQAMARRPRASELIVGVLTDPVFGPVLMFGQGGIAVEVMADRTFALPPLNMVLAKDMVSKTRVAKMLAGYRDRPAADVDAVCQVLIHIANLIADQPEIVELDINPLLADHDGVIALDARIRIEPKSGTGTDRFAIRPYPSELEEEIEWQGRNVLLRPIRPEDGAQHQAFFEALTPEDVRTRAFIRIRELQPSQLARLTQIDYDREMAFIATRPNSDGIWETLGVARAIADPDNIKAEFAVTVRSDLKAKGLGRILMKKLIEYCRARGTHEMVGEALPENYLMQRLAKHCGFTTALIPEDGVVVMRLELGTRY